MVNTHEVMAFDEAATVLKRSLRTVQQLAKDKKLASGGIRGTVTIESVIAFKRLLETGQVKRGRPRKPKGAKNGSQKEKRKAQR